MGCFIMALPGGNVSTSVGMMQESALPLDASCDPVHAWRFNHANTIFQVLIAFYHASSSLVGAL